MKQSFMAQNFHGVVMLVGEKFGIWEHFRLHAQAAQPGLE